ncbi:MAG: hypothetical protein K6E41_08205 [Solobacterium sp.]|nr:hypothetical protein [Solobacterium sp.]
MQNYSLRRKIRNLRRTIRERWIRHIMPDPSLPAEQRAYAQLKTMIPELNSYKQSTVYHIQRLAYHAGCRSFGEYCSFLEKHPDELSELKRNITLTGTNFFRGNDWPYFSKECLSTYRDKDLLRIWCAGCSSGKEVYSVILSALDFVPLQRIEVLASDYNDEMLALTAVGTYSPADLEMIPEHLQRYIVRTESRRFTFAEELKERITVQKIDLLKDAYPTGFDIILCRNVIKFFSPEVIPLVQQKLVHSLNENGFLFLSTDGNHKGAELIKDPEAMGAVQMDGRCIYRRCCS